MNGINYLQPLLDELQNWPGRTAMEAALAARGFRAPQLWQEQELQLYGLEHASEVKLYWDETTKECMYSAGRVNSRTRSFPDDGLSYYRSAYLDHLANQNLIKESIFPEPDLLPCIHDHLTEYYKAGWDYRTTIADQAKQYKQLDIEHFKPLIELQDRENFDLRAFFKEQILRIGFVPHKRRFIKKTPAGNIFECWVEGRRGRTEYASLPIYFYLSPQFGDEFFYISNFNRFMKKIDWYRSGVGFEDLIVGMLAHIEMLDILYKQLSQ